MAVKSHEAQPSAILASSLQRVEPKNFTPIQRVLSQINTIAYFVITITQQYTDTKFQNRSRKKVSKSTTLVRLFVDPVATVHASAPV